jgi:hypothetical protein
MKTWWRMPFDGVEQAQLRARVGPFPAHDHAGALGVGGQVEQVGEFGELGAVTQFPVGLDRGQPVRHESSGLPT